MASLSFGGENLTRGEWLFLAKLTQRAGRYEEMAYSMRKLVSGLNRPELPEERKELTAEERTLLSLSHKNVVHPLQVAWRASCAVEMSSEVGQPRDLVRAYITELELELSQRCATILELLDSKPIYQSDDENDKSLDSSSHQSFRRDDETKAFYEIMKGDYNKYLAELKVDEAWPKPAERALKSYKKAKVLVANLPATNPTKLTLAVNFSVFYYEISKIPLPASQMAKDAYEQAADELVRTCGSGPYKESTTTILMKLLRDNLNSWNSKDPEMMDKRPWRPLFFKGS